MIESGALFGTDMRPLFFQCPFHSRQMLVVSLSPVGVIKATPSRTSMRMRDEATEFAIGIVLALIAGAGCGDLHQRIHTRIHDALGERIIGSEFGFKKELGRRLEEAGHWRAKCRQEIRRPERKYAQPDEWQGTEFPDLENIYRTHTSDPKARS